MMNKNSLYIIIALVVGLLGGWLIFGGASDHEESDRHTEELESNQLWTCSMHPQIMKSEPGDCPICGMDLIPAETDTEGLAANEIRMTDNAMALANIQTTIVGGDSTSQEDGSISLSGKIATNEENNSVQASYFDGRIERLNVNYEGQTVSKGQLLATIYAPNLVAAQQELITTSALKESQPALYKAVRNKLKNWKLSERQIDAIEFSGKTTENFPVYATVSGTVSEVMTAEGDYVKQGQPIVKLSNLNSVWAEFDAYEQQISEVKKGQDILIIPNAYPNQTFEGKISFIDPILSNSKRTVTVRATIQNKDELFKPGMFVTGKIKTTMTSKPDVLHIPASAVMWTGERSLVYVKTNPNEPVFEMRDITIGNRNGENYEVASGLQQGEEIVTNGAFTVDAAAQLQGKTSMMNQTATTKEDSSILTEMKLVFPKGFSQSFEQVMISYLQMKDAFVAGNSSQVSQFANTAATQLESFETSTLGAMEKMHLKQSLKLLKEISSTENLEAQRADFVKFNEQLIPIAMNVEGNGEVLYLQKCPMANNNKGALWLSHEKEIRNPYFGDAMLTCGEIQREIE